ncbi:hypothetical protein LARI1_G006011 [Lachnellula arida]|uniref:Endosomal spry domain-containing protein n=2 Tax=Lachnellula TaxID=47830 RepID=A0A8T9BJV0_9HELO|nr:hypothetical protein LARI1_G006011 [Lachnellula arida]TVY94478.1 hypothetical protein LAWI1_G001211 [Lachnellula willkommii]
MAPLPSTTNLKSYLTTLLRRTPSPSPTSSLGTLAARTQAILPRDTTVDPSSGVTPFNSIPNKAIFALFGLIGVGIVCTAIWFFFWAKNGGFYFQENDWDDYKSTVLRRKGPNGTTLSGATESTDLGGGSVVHGEKSSKWGRKKKGMKRYKDFDEEGSEITGSAGGSSLGSEMSELKWKVKQDRKKAKKHESRLRGGDLGAEEAMLDDNETVDGTVENELRAYRHEKPARVGGLNRQADGSAWDGSTNDNSTVASDLLSHREHTPTNTPTKVKKERNDNYTGGTGGIRKVVSTSANNVGFWNRTSKKSNVDQEHIKAEAAKLQEKGRAAQRRDFSFNVGDDSTVASEQEERQARREAREARRAARKAQGSIVEGSEISSNVSSDLGTKAYHHPIPGLSSTAGSEYTEERRKKRAGGGGYRRGRRDSLSDDGN